MCRRRHRPHTAAVEEVAGECPTGNPEAADVFSGFSSNDRSAQASEGRKQPRNRDHISAMTTTNGHTGQEWVSSALDQFEGRLLRYAQRITGDAHRAADVVQETFLKLCREDRATLDGHLAQWLYTVCRNKALDVRRKESRMTALVEPTLNERNGHASPDDSVETHDTAARILECIGELADNQQECIRLKFQHGLSYREIAAVTELSVSNVGFLIHTGLKKVRQRMTREG